MLNEINIDTEHIKLDQLLKLIGIAGTGGHGKILIKEGNVKINDNVVYERGKKVFKEDRVEIIGEGSYIVK